jgi:hypothetical protein
MSIVAVARVTRLLHVFGRLDEGGATSFACCPLGLVSLPPKTHGLHAPMQECLDERCVYSGALLARLTSTWPTSL